MHTFDEPPEFGKRVVVTKYVGTMRGYSPLCQLIQLDNVYDIQTKQRDQTRMIAVDGARWNYLTEESHSFQEEMKALYNSYKKQDKQLYEDILEAIHSTPSDAVKHILENRLPEHRKVHRTKRRKRHSRK
jgi:hypothetical protein